MFAVLRALWVVVRANPGGIYSLLARATAEGVLGRRVQLAYLALAGRKTKLGLLIGLAYLLANGLCVFGLLPAVHWCAVASWIRDVSLFLVAWGVVDASARATPPKVTR